MKVRGMVIQYRVQIFRAIMNLDVVTAYRLAAIGFACYTLVSLYLRTGLNEFKSFIKLRQVVLWVELMFPYFYVALYIMGASRQG